MCKGSFLLFVRFDMMLSLSDKKLCSVCGFFLQVLSSLTSSSILYKEA